MSSDDDSDADGYPLPEASTSNNGQNERASYTSIGQRGFLLALVPNSPSSSHFSMTTDPTTSAIKSLLASHNLPESTSLLEYYGTGASSCGYCKKKCHTKLEMMRNETGRKSFGEYQQHLSPSCH